MTTDELPLLLQLDNPYWRGERLALLGSGIAGAGAAALAIRFHVRGAEVAKPG